MKLTNNFISGRGPAIVGALICRRAEGGNTGRNSETDQRQIQATAGGASSPVVGSDGSINTGTLIDASGFGSTVNLTDQGAVNRAFQFAETVTEQVGKVLAGNAATTTATVNANTSALKTYADAIGSNTDTGAAANSNKTLLYLGIAAAVVAVIFVFKR